MMMMMLKNHSCSFYVGIVWFYFLLAAALVCSNHGNPANDLVDIINSNRTSGKLPSLNRSPGIGCMALQYAVFCKGNCPSNNTLHCNPSEANYTEIFAPNCGIELPTFGSITGQIIGCHSKHLHPSQAFSEVLIKDKRSLSLLRNKSYTDVGVGVVRDSHKGPSYWCVLFSSDHANTTFVLEDHGLGIKQKKGCFSGSSFPCSAAETKMKPGWISNGVMVMTCLWTLLLPVLVIH